MTHVKLLGELGEKFGSEWISGDSSVRDILKLIDCQVDGFKEYFAECYDKGIEFSIQNGDDFLDAEDLSLPVLKDTVIITPVPSGAGKGMKKLITGLLILGAMFLMPGTAGLFTSGGAAGTTINLGIAGGGSMTLGTSAYTAIATGGTLNTLGLFTAMLGVNLALAGIMEMSVDDADPVDSGESNLFTGAEQQIEQGKPVPLLYGQMKIGASPINQGFVPGKITGNNYNSQAPSSSTYEGWDGDDSTGTIIIDDVDINDIIIIDIPPGHIG